MKILVIGKGGREHALVWKLAQSPRATRVYCAPGNAGTARDGVNVPLDLNDHDALLRFAQKEDIGLTVVGPEEPLARGIVDTFQAHKLRIFGPTREAAQLESSKVFAKEFMRRSGIPTADFQVFDHPDAAKLYVSTREAAQLPDGRLIHYPFKRQEVIVEKGVKYLLHNSRRIRVSPPERLVIKADGLAAGKGVFVTSNTEEALAAVDSVMQGEFGAAGSKLVIEKRLEGPELSLLALVSGRSILPLPASQDHKRVGEGDTGLNTGGMGAYCPAPLATPELLSSVHAEILVPTIHQMRHERRPYRGVLYTGLMMPPQGPRVLEYNARFGDPETQPILLRLKSDLLDLLEAVVDDRLEQVADDVVWDPRPAVCVVLCSAGYPGTYERGCAIFGIEEAESLPDVKVFHAGTKPDGQRVLTDGGRVLGVTALGDTLALARARAYEAVARIQFRGVFYRTDIAGRALDT